MPNGEMPRSPEEWQEIAQGNLTKEEKEELKTLDNDPLVKEWYDLKSLYDQVFSSDTLEERAKKLEEFKQQHPELEEKLKRIQELEKKAAQGIDTIPSGM